MKLIVCAALVKSIPISGLQNSRPDGFAGTPNTVVLGLCLIVRAASGKQDFGRNLFIMDASFLLG